MIFFVDNREQEKKSKNGIRVFLYSTHIEGKFQKKIIDFFSMPG